MAIQINYPQPGRTGAVAPVGGTGPNLCMCVSGQIFGFGGPPLALLTTSTVWVKVYAGLLSQTHPPFDTGAVSATISGQNWSCLNVPVPTCSATAPYPPLTAVAWELGPTGSGSGSGVLDVAVQPFCGRCASSVDCGSGSGVEVPCGSGSGSGSGIMLAGGGSAGLAVALAPALWSLVLAGFVVPLAAALNGSWLLRLRDATGAEGIWDNGGDGDAVPHLELSCAAPPLGIWRLRLRHGAVIFEYAAPAAWEALGPLTLTADALDDCPSTLVITPV